MYAPTYGYGPGNASSPFNPNGAPPQPQTPHQQHQLGQQPQHMMYNQQMYGPGVHQSPYESPSPGMGGNSGGLGMMQNNGMAHMGGGNGMSQRDFSQALTLLNPLSATYGLFLAWRMHFL